MERQIRRNNKMTSDATGMESQHQQQEGRRRGPIGSSLTKMVNGIATVKEKLPVGGLFFKKTQDHDNHQGQWDREMSMNLQRGSSSRCVG